MEEYDESCALFCYKKSRNPFRSRLYDMVGFTKVSYPHFDEPHERQVRQPSW